MRAALSLAAFALLLAVTGGILVGAYDVHRDLSDLHGVIDNAGGALRGIEKTTAQLDQMIAKLSTTSDTVNEAAIAEKANWQKTSKNAADTAYDLRALIARTDRAFVDGTLQHFNTQTLPAIDQMIVANGDELQDMLGRLGDSADGVTKVTTTLDARIADPRIDEIIGHFNTVSGSLDKISVDAVAMSGDMRIDIHRMSQPPSKLHTVLNVAWTTAKFGSLFIP